MLLSTSPYHLISSVDGSRRLSAACTSQPLHASARQVIAITLAAILSLSTGGALAESDSRDSVNDPKSRPNGCLIAKSYETIGQRKTAMEKYRELLAKDPQNECGLSGVDRLRAAMVASLIANALALERVGGESAALQLLKDGITDQELELTSEQLERFRQARADLSFDRATRHQTSGDFESANTAYKKTIELAPKSKTATRAAELRRVTELATIHDSVAKGEYVKARQLWLHLLSGTTAAENTQDAAEVAKRMESGSFKVSAFVLPDNLRFLATGTSTFDQEVSRLWFTWSFWLILGLCIVIVLALTRSLAYRFRNPLLQIEDFDVKGMETKTSTSFSAMVRSRLDSLRKSAQPGERIQLITAPIEPVEIPTEVQSIVSNRLAWIGILPWLLSALFPRKTLRLSGFLHPPGRRGPGVTLQLADDQKLVATDTIWQRDFSGGRQVDKSENVATYYRLADYGSIWLMFQLGGQGFRCLGTPKWYAFALFRAAYHQNEIDNHPEAARKLYIEALRIDPNFHSAKYNFARLAGSSNKQQGVELLEEIKLSLKEGNGDTFEDPTLYSAFYTRSSWLYDLSALPENSHRSEELLANAESEAKELLANIEKVLAGDTRHLSSLFPSMTGANERVVEYLTRVQQVTEMMYAGLLAASGRLEEAVEKLAVKPDVQAEESAKELGSEEWHVTPPNLRYASTLVGRIQYNLACTCSIIADNIGNEKGKKAWLTVAMFHLQRAACLDALGDKVDQDLSLSALRNDSEFGDQYRSIVDEGKAALPAADRELPLAKAVHIGRRYAAALAEKGIESADQLVNQTRTACERYSLARDLDVDPLVVLQWAEFADLLYLTDFSIDQANLVFLSGCRSLDDVEAMEPRSLQAATKAMADIHGTVVGTIERYTQWVVEASALPRRISKT